MMKQKEHPSVSLVQQSRGGNINKGHTSKDKPKLSKRQRRVHELLCTGKHSVTDITIKLGYADPRSYIRYLRDKGIHVRDETIQQDDVQYKRYWIESIPTDTSISNIKSVGEAVRSDFKDLFDKGRIRI